MTTPHPERSKLAAAGLGDDDWAAWQATGRPPDAFDAWLTDRVARCPEGATAIAVYGADDAHDFARRAVLDALRVGAGDRLLDVGCGGGLLLRDALAAGAAATGVDHSAAMVALARDRAPGADVVEADAAALPFAGGAFTAVTMVMAFLFLPDPAAALAEIRRVLGPGGRVAVYTPGPALRGTPALPHPIAAHARVYDDAELAQLLRRAGLRDVGVADDGGAQLVTGAR